MSSTITVPARVTIDLTDPAVVGAVVVALNDPTTQARLTAAGVVWGAAPPPPPPPAVPTIDYFKADRTNVLVGDTVTLSWSVTGQDAIVTLSSDLGGLTFPAGIGTKAYPINAAGTEVFTLAATNAGGGTTATVTVTASAVVPPPPPPPSQPVGVAPRPPWLFPLQTTFDPTTNTLSYVAPSGPAGWSQYLVDTFAVGRSHWAGQDAGPLNGVDDMVVTSAPPDTGGPRPPADPNDPNRVNLDLTPYPPFVPPVLPPTLPALQPGVQAAKGDQLYADRVNQLRSEGFTDAQLVALGVELP